MLKKFCMVFLGKKEEEGGGRLWTICSAEDLENAGTCAARQAVLLCLPARGGGEDLQRLEEDLNNSGDRAAMLQFFRILFFSDNTQGGVKRGKGERRRLQAMARSLYTGSWRPLTRGGESAVDNFLVLKRRGGCLVPPYQAD